MLGYDYDRRIACIDEELNRIDEELSSLPEGSASPYCHGDAVRIKGMLNGKIHFYNKQELPLAKKLIYKKYLILKKRELESEIKILKACRKHQNTIAVKREKYLTGNPLRADMISGFLSKTDIEYADWSKPPFASSAPMQEYRTEKVWPGLYVRSKSEVMIALTLKEMGIPFRYEEPLLLGSQVYYPDFLLRDNNSNSFIWYEHFGKMDDRDYAYKAFKKLSVYADNGLYPGINLIVTFETRAHRLKISQIKAAVGNQLSII